MEQPSTMTLASGEEPLVAVLDRQFVDVEYSPSIEQKVLAGVAKVQCFGACCVEDIPDTVKDASVLLIWHHIPYIDKQTMLKFEKTKALVRIGVGYDNIDVKGASELGIRVSNVPDYGVDEVADSTMWFLLSMMRKAAVLSMHMKKSEWSTKDSFGATRLQGKTLGIVGLGRIGTAVALRAKAFHLNVAFYDPFLEPGRGKAFGITECHSLHELLSCSDIVSLHCPGKHVTTKDRVPKALLPFVSVEQGSGNNVIINNYHIINEKILFESFKKGSYLINTARGSCLDLKALKKALETGHLTAAGLDVFETEPFAEKSLLELPNLISTPHTAFYSDQGNVEMIQKAAEEARRILKGEDPLYCVNSAFLSFVR